MSVRGSHARRAFTLMELTVSLAVSAMLMAALGSAVAIAAAALPAENSVQTRVLDTSRALEHLSADLESAVYVLSTNATSPGLGIPDRNNDGAPDTQVISWAGKRGDPIQLVENGATPETVLDSASAFSASFRGLDVSEGLGSVSQTSKEIKTASFPGASGRGETRLELDTLWGVVLQPQIPVGATGWSPTRVEIAVKNSGPRDDEITAQVRDVTADAEPGESVLAEGVILETALPSSFEWVSIDLAGESILNPAMRVSLVIGNTGSDNDAGKFEYGQGGSGLWRKEFPDGGLLGGLLGGGSDSEWTMYSSSRELFYRLYGTYTTPGPVESVTHHFMTSATLFLSATGDTDIDMDTTVNLVNRPQLVHSIWEAEFATDPTLHDINADGIGDWVISPAGAFPTGNLAGGVWDARTAIKTNPPKDMPGVVIGEIRWRCTDLSQPGASWTLNFDQAGGVQGNVTIRIARPNASEQSLAMTTSDGAGTTNVLVSMGGLPLEMFEVRVLIDPASDSVALQIDGVEVGAYLYLSSPYADDERVSTVSSMGTGVEVDSVRIREGGAP